jgi:hypothetical protein
MKPGTTYKTLRRVTQLGGLAVVFSAPLLGGWQRLDRNNLANWDSAGWDLPAWLLHALPLGEAPQTAYQVNQIMGSGASSSAFGLPALDPVAGLVAASAFGFHWKLLLAWSLPVILSLIAGRFFCGWMCPFGTLSRFIDRTLERLPWRPKALSLPDRRPIRWLVLGGGLIAAFLGVQIAIYTVLPHLVMQMTAYSFWLMGGGGALFGWFMALLVMGLIFGPTTYCSAVCPTGAALSLGGRVRQLSIYIEDASQCGKGCDLCTRTCWLQLDPASGNPGADCDLCTRCFNPCPKHNLRVGRAPKVRVPAVAASALLLLALLVPQVGYAANQDTTPRLLIDRIVTQGDVQVAIALVDRTGVQLDADDPFAETGVEITIQITRGEPATPDARGRIPFRDLYEGPLALQFAGEEHRFTAPNSPRSTPRRRQYRLRTDVDFSENASVTVLPIEGWLKSPLVIGIPPHHVGQGPRAWYGFAAGVLLFGGLLMAAAAASGRRHV